MTSKCGKNKKVVEHEAQPSVSLMFLPHFDVLCDLLLNRRSATWNLIVLYNKELKHTKKSLFILNFATLTDTKIASRVKSFSTEKRLFFFLLFIVTVHGLGKAFF